MKHIVLFIIALVLISCDIKQDTKTSITHELNQQDLQNKKVRNYKLLEGMYSDTYFPKASVDKVKTVLIEFCFRIEQTQPKNLTELYELSHKTTSKINELQSDFIRNGSEIETAAREIIAMDIHFISSSYGFNADMEELISNRDW